MFRFFWLVALSLLVEADEGLVSRQKVVMGTFVTISVDKPHKSLIEPAFSLLKKIDDSLSSFNENSPIYKLNKSKSAQLNFYSSEALKLSLAYYTQTHGYFDIAIGKITEDLYRFGKDERVARKKELDLASTDIKGLHLYKNRAFLSDNIKIDLGGMGKGYGVDKLKDFLHKHNVVKAIIALSGDIRCIGECSIAVNNPLQQESSLATFVMKNSGVSTSGNYNRYIQDKKYNHLINPETKASEKNFISVTLISNTLSSSKLDAYATAVSVMPLQKAYKFLQKQSLAYIILQADKKIVLSPNLRDYVSDLKLKGLCF